MWNNRVARGCRYTKHGMGAWTDDEILPVGLTKWRTMANNQVNL